MLEHLDHIEHLLTRLVTYLTFGADSPNEQLSVAGWAVMSVILVPVGVMLWLMSSGRLPAYIVQVQDEDDARKSGSPARGYEPLRRHQESDVWRRCPSASLAPAVFPA